MKRNITTKLGIGLLAAVMSIGAPIAVVRADDKADQQAKKDAEARAQAAEAEARRARAEAAAAEARARQAEAERREKEAQNKK